MPTYDYKCTECGYKFEYFQSMKEPLLQVCPECNGKLKRLIGTGSGLIFKGSGFYETDYKHKHSSLSKPTDKEKKTETKTTEVKSEKKEVKTEKKAS